MTFDNNTSTYTLSSGRTFYANHGILGIAADGHDVDGCEVAEGYDGMADTDDLTAADRAEIATEMIRRWTVFMAAAPAQDSPATTHSR